MGGQVISVFPGVVVRRGRRRLTALLDLPVNFCPLCRMFWLLEHRLMRLITFIHLSRKQLLRVDELSRVLANYLQTKK